MLVIKAKFTMIINILKRHLLIPMQDYFNSSHLKMRTNVDYGIMDMDHSLSVDSTRQRYLDDPDDDVVNISLFSDDSYLESTDSKEPWVKRSISSRNC